MKKNHGNISTQNLKWQEKSGSIVLLLFLFWPIGVFLMWKSQWDKSIKVIISCFIGIVCCFILVDSSPPPVVPVDTSPSNKSEEHEVSGVEVLKKEEFETLDTYLWEIVTAFEDEYNAIQYHISNEDLFNAYSSAEILLEQRSIFSDKLDTYIKGYADDSTVLEYVEDVDGYITLTAVFADSIIQYIDTGKMSHLTEATGVVENISAQALFIASSRLFMLNDKEFTEEEILVILDVDGTDSSVDGTDSSADEESNETEPRTITKGEENALKSAKGYLDIMAFSRSGLIAQLEYDEYTKTEATYGAANCGADWDDQAAKKAKAYLDIMAFSKVSLIEQLEHDGFTHSQASKGARANGY